MQKIIIVFIWSLGCTFPLWADDTTWTAQTTIIPVTTPNALPAPNTTTLLPSTRVDWNSLCTDGEALLDVAGCAPDCTRQQTTAACEQLFQNSQIGKFSYIPSPYDPHGVFIFRLNEYILPATANFALAVGSPPSHGRGYACEVVYEDGTPALLINKSYVSYNPIIAIDYHCTPDGSACRSNYYANFMTQSLPSAPHFAWYKNPNHPLYLICLAYTESGTNPTTLQSIAGCSGTTGSCVYYTLE